MNAVTLERKRVKAPAPPKNALTLGQRIRRRAEDRLRRSGYLAMSNVSCDAHEGVVYLYGRLPSYYLKQIAQAVAAGVEGVRRVVNRIEVCAPARPQAPVGHDPGEPRS